jgi:predicted nucleotidyltransferase component of viral defense system
LTEIKNLISQFSEDNLFEKFYFVGGTAMSYYLNHRISYDIDLISTEKLDVDRLSGLSIKYSARYIPDKNESTFRINTGNNLREYKMAFNIQGIKVEFFYPNDSVRLAVLEKHKNNCEQIGHIKILPLEAISELKLLALFRRKKIRDLFDIYVLLHEDIIDTDLIDRICALEYTKTFVEYVEEFQDDRTESLDFDRSNTYHKEFHNLKSKEQYLKETIIDLYLKRIDI